MNIVREIDTLAELCAGTKDGAPDSLAGVAVQGLTIEPGSIDWADLDLAGTVFLGTDFCTAAHEHQVRERGALVLPKFSGRPYDPYRSKLYDVAELDTRIDDLALDQRIYEYSRHGGTGTGDLLEALAQRIHDWAIDDALTDLLAAKPTRPVVGIMGGHSAPRGSEAYRKATRAGWLLGRADLLVASGGGPGVMEAANLGAWLSAVDSYADVSSAIDTLSAAPGYDHPDYRQAAQSVLDQHGSGALSISVPTWFYGHEPSNVFSTHIAKYFSNSLREDRLLAMAKAGIIFTPGSAGTAQEVFQDAAQNHYATFGPAVPMVFLDNDHWKRSGLWEAVTRQADGHPYRELLTLVDDPDQAADFILTHHDSLPSERPGHHLPE